VPGFLLAAASTMVGALAAFFLSRSLFRPTVERLIATRPRLRNFDALIAQDGWRLVCLLRISPVMPFSAASYMLGLSSIVGLPVLIFAFIGVWATIIRVRPRAEVVPEWAALTQIDNPGKSGYGLNPKRRNITQPSILSQGERKNVPRNRLGLGLYVSA
jgi:hypothetical protein